MKKKKSGCSRSRRRDRLVLVCSLIVRRKSLALRSKGVQLVKNNLGSGLRKGSDSRLQDALKTKTMRLRISERRSVLRRQLTHGRGLPATLS